ncbi:hypothetical protein [Ruficoccus sp. ZRK36]|uniref:hypothetical protein n=1 Tax=Ruficoccus sp. ZRK36 TaxID=2866311 RepID=UPI001C7317C5|nr:hypothetical protein [Ruficoccus sp. ZRK36]QYY36769.1 hypothetical protein K0V07_04655 [Ruficoccus sp. ZRK36]
MTPRTLVLALASLTAASFVQAQWTDLVSDDFESYTFGEQPTGNWYRLGNNASSGSNELITDTDGGIASASGLDLPGSGAGHGNALYFYDNNTKGSARAGLNLDPTGSSNYDIVRMSVDFKFDAIGSTSTGFGFIGLVPADFTAFGGAKSTALAINLRYDASLSWSGGSIDLNDTNWHSLEVVANRTDGSFSYTALDGSGSTSIDANSYDLYVDGARVGSSVAMVVQDDDSILEMGRFGINTYSGSEGVEFTIDNLKTYTAPVPEPAESAVLLGAVVLLASCLLRRKRA